MTLYAQQLKEEYEKRIRVLERAIHGEKERRRQLGFQNKQLEAHLKRVQKDNDGLEKKLKAINKCAECSHLDQRSKSYNALNELLRGSVPALEPEAVASTSAPNRNDEIRRVKVVKSDLQQCVDKLQSMLREKGREAIATERYYNEAILERERQITRLQKELEMCKQGNTEHPDVSQHAETKLKALMKERTELLNRIYRLENNGENQCGMGGSSNGLYITNCPPNTSVAVDDDVNPYCEYCRNRVKSLNNMMNERNMDYNFVNDEPSSSVHRAQEESVLEKKLQKLTLALETERMRNKAVENALKEEKDIIDAKYQKLFGQYESLEVELGKRRNAEMNAVDITEQNSSTIRLVAQLREELENASSKVQSLERELANAKQTIHKDAQFGILRLHRQIEELERHKRESARIVENQKIKVHRFEDEVAALNSEKTTLQRKCAELELANDLAIQEKLEQLGIIETLRKELSRVEEAQNEATKAHNAELEAYQQLVKQKDDERGALIAELCVLSRPEVPLRDSVAEIHGRNGEQDGNRELLEELRELNHVKQEQWDRIAHLESELRSVKEQLQCKTEEVEKEVILKNSMHDDLAKVRTMLLKKESETLDLNNQLKVTEVKIMKLETELANATDRLQIEQTTASTLKMTVEELEDMLQEKNSELIAAAREKQHCANEIQKMKEMKYDLETKLTLQGRELKETRERLAVLRKKKGELEQQAVSSPNE